MCVFHDKECRATTCQSLELLHECFKGHFLPFSDDTFSGGCRTSVRIESRSASNDTVVWSSMPLLSASVSSFCSCMGGVSSPISPAACRRQLMTG